MWSPSDQEALRRMDDLRPLREQQKHPIHPIARSNADVICVMLLGIEPCFRHCQLSVRFNMLDMGNTEINTMLLVHKCKDCPIKVVKPAGMLAKELTDTSQLGLLILGHPHVSTARLGGFLFCNNCGDLTASSANCCIGVLCFNNPSECGSAQFTSESVRVPLGAEYEMRVDHKVLYMGPHGKSYPWSLGGHGGPKWNIEHWSTRAMINLG